MNRTEISALIVNRLEREIDSFSSMYDASCDQIGYFIVDDLLPFQVAMNIYRCFPAAEEMLLKKSNREYKYIAAQMDSYSPILEETIYAFQDPGVVKCVSNICKIENLYPDKHLYAGGISMMGYNHFLNPHLDNSHDKNRENWRVLNLLYYVTPDWPVTNGGNLELWPEGIHGKQILIHSKFNRLAVMATHTSSWHSVSPVKSRDSARYCVSNYYFSDSPLRGSDNFHVTSFRGRPGQRIRDFILRSDSSVRMMIRKLFKKGIIETKHIYKK
ncbi:MAG: 2OG-Fe(II) oxygenase [Nitrosomonas sp.]|nr:2OG-Fe(II) oxygenase [Nitrosomonas sp.]